MKTWYENFARIRARHWIVWCCLFLLLLPCKEWQRFRRISRLSLRICNLLRICDGSNCEKRVSQTNNANDFLLRFSSTKFVYMVEYSCGTYTMSSYYFSKLCNYFQSICENWIWVIIMIKIALLLLVIVPMVFFGMNFDGNVFVVYFYAFMCMINLALVIDWNLYD